MKPSIVELMGGGRPYDLFFRLPFWRSKHCVFLTNALSCDKAYFVTRARTQGNANCRPITEEADVQPCDVGNIPSTLLPCEAHQPALSARHQPHDPEELGPG